MSFKLLTPQVEIAEGPSLSNPTELSIVAFPSVSGGFTNPAPSPVVNVDDTSFYLFGGSAIKLPSQGGGVSQTARKTGITAFDMTDKSFRICFATDNYLHIANLRFDISSDNFTNWSRGLIVASNTTIVATPLVGNLVWYQAVIPWGLFTVGGGTGAVRTAITAIQMVVIDDNTGNKVNVWWNKCATVAEPTNALFTWTFDDGRDGVYSNAKPLFDAADIRASFAPIKDKIGVTNYMTMPQLQSLYLSGWDPAVHAYNSSVHNNYKTLPDALCISDALLMKSYMRNNGFGVMDNFFCPDGAFATVSRYNAFSQYFNVTRGTYPSMRECYPPGNPQLLRVYNPGTKTVAAVQAVIDEAYANQEWLLFQCHNVVNSLTGDNNDVLTADLNTYINYIIAKGANQRQRSLGEVILYGAT